MTKGVGHTCLNCGIDVSGNFCPACGQRADTSRFTWHEIWHNATHALTHMDSGVGYSLKQLAMRPGHAIREYLQGRRKPYFNAFTMMLTFTALCSILYVHYDVETQLAGLRLNTFEESNPTIVHKFFAIRSLYLILLCALGDWAMFRDRGYSMPEMVIFNTYQFSFIAAAQVLCVPLFVWADHDGWASVAKGGFILAAVAYMLWVRIQFFQAGRNAWTILRIIALLGLIYTIVALTGRFVVRPILLNMHH